VECANFGVISWIRSVALVLKICTSWFNQKFQCRKRRWYFESRNHRTWRSWYELKALRAHPFSYVGLTDELHRNFAEIALSALCMMSGLRAIPPALRAPVSQSSPKYLPNANWRGGTHWTLLRNLLFEFNDYGLQSTSLAAQVLHLRT